MKYYKGANELDASFYYKWHGVDRGNAGINKINMHLHQSVEVMLVTDGEIEIIIGNNPPEIIRRNQAVMILPFRPHKYITKNKTEFLRCNFASPLVPDFFSLIDGKESETGSFTLSSVTIFQLKEMFTKKVELTQYNIHSFLYSVINDYTSCVSLTESNFDSHILTRAIQYMDRHKCENMSIGDVAKNIGYSKSHLSYCINKISKINFSTLLSMLRIENARVMLKNTDISVLDIAIMCGFGSERSFYRQFKKITGLSPKDYRKNQVLKIKIDPPMRSN